MKRHIMKFILMAILMTAVFMAFARDEKIELNASMKNIAEGITNH